jgi:hypothetical protein
VVMYDKYCEARMGWRREAVLPLVGKIVLQRPDLPNIRVILLRVFVWK